MPLLDALLYEILKAGEVIIGAVFSLSMLSSICAGIALFVSRDIQ